MVQPDQPQGTHTEIDVRSGSSVDDPDDVARHEFEVGWANAARILAWVCLALGVSVIVLGWWIGLEAVRTAVPGEESMKANTALGIILISLVILSLRSGRPRISVGLSAVLVVLGFATLLEYVLDTGFAGLDTLLGSDAFTQAPAAPGRMAVNTASCFTLLGIVLTLLSLRRLPATRQWLATGVSLIAYIALCGYILSVPALSGWGWSSATKMAPHSAIAILVLASCAVMSDLESGWARIFASPLAGGRILRRYLWICLAVPVSIAAVVVRLLPTAHVEDPLDQLTVVVTSLIMVVILFLISHGAESMDSERHSHAKAVEKLSVTDSLTGLDNRRHLMSRLTSALAATGPNDRVVVLFINIDDFKQINDVHGHPAGDAVLRRIAGDLRAALRSDDVVARIAGDEFVAAAIIDNGDGAAAAFVDRVRSGLTDQVLWGGNEIRFTVSLGAAVSGRTISTPDELIEAADRAMYTAKKAGEGGTTWHGPSIRSAHRLDLATQKWLRQAVDDGAFEIHYQPIVNLSNGSLSGVEALLRLRPPESDRLVMPADFIRVAERSRLMGPLGQVSIAHAIEEVASHDGPGPDHLAVNVSAAQALDPATAWAIGDALDRTGLDPSRLVVELIETAVFDPDLETAPFLADMRSIGVQLAIDDFGTGYSNLAALESLAVQWIKLDRSLTARLTDEGAIRAITGALVTFSRELETHTVAEGVERSDELLMARELGIGHVQGYLIRRPARSLEEALDYSIVDHELA